MKHLNEAFCGKRRGVAFPTKRFFIMSAEHHQPDQQGVSAVRQNGQPKQDEL